jgi:hypothetical protein
MLMNWSSPFPHEESSMNMVKNKARPKLLNTRQLEPQEDDDELNDYMPKKGIEKLKENKKEKEKDKEKEKIEKEMFYQKPFSEEMEYPIEDKPFEYTAPQSKDAQLLEKLNYMIYLLEEQKDEKTGQVTEELILYVFLGVFVLFVLDSFFKTGKYSR